jgi:hypothetical protein
VYWIFCRSCLVGHPLRCRLDGRIDVQPDWQLRQFNTGRVLKGKSGRAILWEQNSRVVAIAKRWLGGDLTACYGIPADTILSRLQVVETEQRAIKLEAAERESRQRLVLPLGDLDLSGGLGCPSSKSLRPL